MGGVLLGGATNRAGIVSSKLLQMDSSASSSKSGKGCILVQTSLVPTRPGNEARYKLTEH